MEIKTEGKKIVFRYPKISDTEKLQKFVNQARIEGLKAGGFLAKTKMVSLKEEKIWLKQLLFDLKKKNKVHILAECGKGS